MPRIRSLQPDLWEDEALGACSPLAMLVFVGLITQADDSGRLRAHPAKLRAILFPYREDMTARKIADALAELEAAELIQFYAVDGQQFAWLRSWAKHQRIDRPTASRMPEPPEFVEPSREIVEPSADPRPGEEGKGEEGKGKEPSARSRARRASGVPGLPPALDTPRFLSAWDAWLGYRREARMRTWQPKTVEFKIRELAEWGEPAAVESIRQSIANGWQGLFAPKSGVAPAVVAPAKPRSEREQIDNLTREAECQGATEAECDAIFGAKTVSAARGLFAAVEARLITAAQRGAA